MISIFSPAAKKEVVTSHIDLTNPTFYPQENLSGGFNMDTLVGQDFINIVGEEST